MDEVELVELSNSYLKELGIDDLELALIRANKNLVTYKIMHNNELDDEKKQMIIKNINVLLSEEDVSIFEHIRDYIFTKDSDFSHKDSNLNESDTVTKIRFSKLKDKDNSVIKSYKSQITKYTNGEADSVYTNTHNKVIKVDTNYKFTDGYPGSVYMKPLVKKRG